MNYLVILFTIFTFAAHAQSRFSYNLNEPDITRHLPEILNEISGLTDYDSSHVACVQDELGIVFIYNFRTGNMVSQHRFDSIGDFEGLTFTGESLFILRSDGRLTEWRNFPVSSKNISHYKLPIQTSNNEGLCYDANHNRIFIAAKSKPFDHDKKSERYIYTFDLRSKKLLSKPIISLNVDYLADKAESFNIPSKSINAKGGFRPFNFRPSSLAVHPITDEIYVISAVDRLLIIMNRDGNITRMEPLDPGRFAKAEGITFLSDGTMIITNEAAGGTPVLYVFNMAKTRNN